MRRRTVPVLALALLACTGPTELADGRDDVAVPGGKADETGYDACELQMVVYYLGLSDTTVEALRADGVHTRAARNLVAYRNGPDGVHGTWDDEPFETVVEVDDVYFVGPVALEQLVDAATGALAWDCAAPPPPEDTLRIVAANLTSGRYQSYDEGHGSRILTALDADVVLVQEMSYGDDTDEALRAWVDEVFGTEFDFARGGSSLPNGVVSRHPIVDAGIWSDPHVSNRDFVWARIDVPGDADLWAVSLHLLTRDEETRQAQVAELSAHLEANVPPEDLLVVGGDLNTAGYEEPALDALSDHVVVEGPFPADAAGNTRTNSSRSKPYDFVLADGELQALRVGTVQGSGRFPYGLVVDTRSHEPIEDLAPARIDDSAAFQMQHMAVVRDFALPAP